MKILLIIGLIVLLVFIGLVILMLSGFGTTTYATDIAHYTEGNDRLTLRYAYTTDWGNSLISHQLHWNDKLVDLRGSMPSRRTEGYKSYPVHADDIAQLRTDLVAQADTANYNWTVWVNPKDFKPEAYERFLGLLRRAHPSLLAQQRNYKPQPTGNEFQDFTLRFIGEPSNIWRVVYFDYTLLQPRLFRREQGTQTDEITINIGGGTSITRRTNKKDPGHGAALGQIKGDTMFLVPYWPGSELYFPPDEFPAFKNKQGRSLTDCYKIVQDTLQNGG
jgi:hypothetical protein